MAQIRYRRTLESSLINLTDTDLRVLDLALAEFRDLLNKKNHPDERYLRVCADTLHDQVLLIKAGEDINEE